MVIETIASLIALRSYEQMTNQPLLDPHTIHEVQMMVRDLIKDKVCELESQATQFANDMPAYAKQIRHAARELDNMQLQTFLLLHDIWDDACTSMIAEHHTTITRPSLPQITPLSSVEIV